MALPNSRVRVTASHSSRLATGSIPVDGSSRKMTGGPPIRAMPALSFRLLPPLYVHGDMLVPPSYVRPAWQQTEHEAAQVDRPVAADQFISMRLQQQRPQDVLHTAGHIFLRYSSEPGVHTQSFSSCHVVQHGVKLRTVTNALLHL